MGIEFKVKGLGLQCKIRCGNTSRDLEVNVNSIGFGRASFALPVHQPRKARI